MQVLFQWNDLKVTPNPGVLQEKIRTRAVFNETPTNYMISVEIWSEHFLIDKEQKDVSEFFYFKYFSRGGFQRNTLREFFDSGTWQIYKKKTNRNKR